jgi:uncharacterized membrane protein
LSPVTEPGKDGFDLDRFRKLPWPRRILRARGRLLASLAIGAAVAALLPGALPLTTRLLSGWDVAVATYLAVALTTMARTDKARIRRNAAMQDEGRFAVLSLTAAAAFASLAAIIFELGEGRGGAQIAIAIVTILLSWTMIHMTFAFHYAHDYYRGAKPGGLLFPGDAPPDYWDFAYFSFVIGMTAQVSDVAVSDRTIRRTVTAHGIVSFLFNTALLALTVNIAASSL